MFASLTGEGDAAAKALHAMLMAKDPSAVKVRIGIIGCGAVAELHHVPAIALDDRASIAMLCDANAELLAKRAAQWGVESRRVTTNEDDVVSDPDNGVDAVLICTPNFLHCDTALKALRNGKHVFCEKPIGLDAAQAREMARVAAVSGRTHMTAFTYRFTPALRYMRHLVATGALGAVRHFRANRFLDWAETSWGWRQYKKTAGAGNLYDMMTHRVDYGAWLVGEPIASVCGSVATFAARTEAPGGGKCAPSEVDDWSAILGQFRGGATGVWEGSTLMKGHHNGGLGKEWAEINGAEASCVYELSDPSRVLMGKHGESLAAVPVPAAFAPKCVAAAAAAGRALPGEKQKDPSFTFRYDLVYEFVSAICEGRAAEPGFDAGAAAQTVCDAVLESFEQRRWVDLAAASQAAERHRRASEAFEKTTMPAEYDSDGAPQPPPGAPPPSDSDDGVASGLPQPPPPPPATPPPEMANQMDEGGSLAWSCKACTFSNPALVGECEMCGNPRGAAGELLISQLKRSARGSGTSTLSVTSGGDAAVSVTADDEGTHEGSP